MKNKNIIVIVIAFIFIFGFKYLINIEGLTSSAIQVLGIFIGTLILWINISIDWPSILVIGVLATVDGFSMNSIIAASYGNSTFVFLLFTFILTYAFSKTSYINKIAYFFINSRFSRRNISSFLICYFGSILFIGSFISPTVLFFIYLPILNTIYDIMKINKGDKLANILMVGTVIMCGISSGMTPIAHAFPIIAMGLYEKMYLTSISYSTYMIIGLTIGLLTALITIIIFNLYLKHYQFDISNRDIKLNIEKYNGEEIIGFIFLICILLWLLPSVIITIFKEGIIYTIFSKINSYGIVMPPLIGIVILSITYKDNKPLLNINEAMKNGVSWPSLIICAATLALGSALTNHDIGITNYLTHTLTPILSNFNVIFMVFIFCLWAGIQTNLSSNLVTSSLVTTACLAITSSISDVNIIGLVILIGMLASFSFATPSAMPCVAIAISTGYTTSKQIMIFGFLIMFVAIILSTFIGYPLSSLLI